MTENKVTIDMTNLTEDERKQLMALCEKAIKKEEWPKVGDKYWYVTGTGDILLHTYGNGSYDVARKSIGNVFRTKKEAEFHAEYLKVCAELERLTDWEEGDRYYCIGCYRVPHTVCYAYGTGDILLHTLGDESYNVKCKAHGLRESQYGFKSEESAQKAIDTIGEDRLKKYYFRVKE